MKNTTIFVITYCIGMAFTYIWRWVMVDAILDGETLDGLAEGLMLALLINYVVLCVITHLRSKNTEKSYLVVFPLIAGLFDILLGVIPFVPSILNIVTIILGVQIKGQEGIQCPVCKEWIQENASICRYCKTNLADYYHKQ